MRVLINHLAAVGHRTGVGHYTAELFRCLRLQAGGDAVDAFPPVWLARGWGACRGAFTPRPPGPGPGRPAPPGRARLGDHLRAVKRGLERACFRLASRAYDLYHEPNFLPLPADCPVVVTIHDLSVLLHPEWHPPERIAFYERYFPEVRGRCAHFITVSDFGRRELIRTLGVPADKVTRTHLGPRPGFAPLPRDQVAAALSRLGLPAGYLLYVGTLEPRKNVLTVLKAYCSLPENVRTRSPLVLVGGYGWKAEPVLEYLKACGEGRGVVWAGYLPERHLGAVYNGARALLFPSLYEGFGLPPLEMLACGGAVICSTAPALVEVVGRQAHLIPPEDFDGWREAIRRALTEDDFLASLRRGACEHARDFSWARCAAETLDVYRKVHAPAVTETSHRRPSA